MGEANLSITGLINSHAEEVSENFPALLQDATSPVVIRNAVKDWPAIMHARRSHDQFRDYLLQFDAGAAVRLFTGPPELEGRIFYDDDFSGLNCRARQTTFRDAFSEIFKVSDEGSRPLAYVGSTPLSSHLPGFEQENTIPQFSGNASAYIWIGGPSRISAHYDFSDNLACVVVGKRQFILFPPDQLENLYAGPLDFSPAGQPISVVDFHHPDFEKFPRFREALDHALVADLEPGDAIFIPSMWQHHVEAFSPLNVLVNYWWRRTPAFTAPPNNALEHAIMTLRDLPAEQKEAWRAMFSHYVFDSDEDGVSHIPHHVRGALNPVTQAEARRIMALLLDRLNA